MEVRSGYKQTELGVIPEDWDIKSLQEGIKLLSGHHVLAQHCNTKGKGTPYITGPADFPDGIIENSKFTERPTTICRKDDILVTVKGSGAGTIVLADDEYCISRQLMAVRVTEWDTAYVHECLRRGASLFGVAATGLIPGLSQGDILNKRIPLPPFLEQRAIATALSNVDALLAKLDRLITKKRDLKQGALQQLLTGKIRLPGFSGAWEVRRMNSLGNTYGGLSGKTKIDFGHGCARYIPFMNVMTGTVIDVEWLEVVNVSSNEVQNLTQKGDLFFNGSSETPEEVGFCSVLLQDAHSLYLNSFCFGFRFNPDAKVNGLFFAYWFRSRKGRETMAVLAQGATRYNIAKSAFLRLELPQPSEGEQTAIATVLSDMDAELAVLEARRAKTRALKQGMMQELLTGRIRLV